MSRRDQLKKEVLATICQHLREANAAGRDPWAEADAAFPSVPQHIRIEAVLSIEDEEIEAWWDGLERTIDGEILRTAIGKAATE